MNVRCADCQSEMKRPSAKVTDRSTRSTRTRVASIWAESTPGPYTPPASGDVTEAVSVVPDESGAMVRCVLADGESTVAIPVRSYLNARADRRHQPNRPDARCGPALPTGDSRFPLRIATPPSGTTLLIVARCPPSCPLMSRSRHSRSRCLGHSAATRSSSIIVTRSSHHALQRPCRRRIFDVVQRRPLHLRPHPFRNHATQLVLAGGLNHSRILTTTGCDLPPNGCASAQPSPSSGCGRTNRLPNGAARQPRCSAATAGMAPAISPPANQNSRA